MYNIHDLTNILKEMRLLLQQIAHHIEALAKVDAPLDQRLHKQEVIDLLGISPRTYDRYKKRGILVPHRLGGHDFYFLHELQAGLTESIRKGKK